ncbi:MAG: type VI secretion system tube protein Hcp [Pyrinomonadaceae bacterium]|nr:type VI secretion system tube protein Hcp [Pyrinomonadaceae bacterium]
MATEFYITIDGKQQGLFKGDSKREERKDKIVGLSFSYDVQSPRDVATGQAVGKRQHGPVTITKEWGAATPQIFQALVENESLRSVLFEFVRTDAGGKEEVYHTVKLSNARVSAIRHLTGNLSGASSERPELEEVSFTFGRIEISNLPGKTMADDDWTSLA